MKRLIALCACALSLSLTGCAGVDLASLADPIVKVAETVTDENTSTAKGVTAGMSSSDAATVLMTRDYYGAVKAIAGVGDKGAARPILEIESHDGKPITIDAKSVKVYAPPTAGGNAGMALAPPPKVESTGLKIFREVRETLAQVLIPWYQIDKGSEIRKLDIITGAESAAFQQSENNSLIRDLAGTRNDLAVQDRAKAEKTRAEADKIRSTP
jgi:hypothetical protein